MRNFRMHPIWKPIFLPHGFLGHGGNNGISNSLLQYNPETKEIKIKMSAVENFTNNVLIHVFRQIHKDNDSRGVLRDYLMRSWKREDGLDENLPKGVGLFKELMKMNDKLKEYSLEQLMDIRNINAVIEGFRNDLPIPSSEIARKEVVTLAGVESGNKGRSC